MLQQLVVRSGAPQAFEQAVQRITVAARPVGGQLPPATAECVSLLGRVVSDQALLVARDGGADVDGRDGPALGGVAVVVDAASSELRCDVNGVVCKSEPRW